MNLVRACLWRVERISRWREEWWNSMGFLSINRLDKEQEILSQSLRDFYRGHSLFL